MSVGRVTIKVHPLNVKTDLGKGGETLTSCLARYFEKEIPTVGSMQVDVSK